ncbi:MAG: hypothetical protein ACREVO_08175 [Steroidobacteraceae bacterium]
MSPSLQSSKRGRKAKGPIDSQRVVRVVFMVRYGAIPDTPEAFAAGLFRKKGTVDAYGSGPAGKPRVATCSVIEACRRVEFTLKELGHISRRRSDGVTAEGKATRRALDRALTIERQTYAQIEREVKLDHDRAEWNRKLAERRRKKTRQRI